jgi:8-oxo-dGTP pyrophosphatase MutT (NUDIX family)
MQIVYSQEEAPQEFSKSIFLAGPSPRDKDHYSWRVDALKILEELGFDGTVFVPLPRNGEWPKDYDAQVDWEYEHLNMADIVAFWVPRDLKNLPAFTTNVEFGMFYESGKVVLGHPDGAPGMRYMVHHAINEKIPVYTNLLDTLRESINRIGGGALRTGGERMVPIHIWKLSHFQKWLASQKNAGNSLNGARALWSFRIGKNKQTTFAYSLFVDIFIAAENRHKTNEFIVSRPDISTVVAYRKTIEPMDTEVILIREFRSASRTSDGFIREVPGGSSWDDNEEISATAVKEFTEETGLAISASRLRKIGERQLNGTFSTHQAHVFACELTAEEMDRLRVDASGGVQHGVSDDTEQTHVEIHRLRDILDPNSNAVDWSMVGMIMAALGQQ